MSEWLYEFEYKKIIKDQGGIDQLRSIINNKNLLYTPLHLRWVIVFHVMKFVPSCHFINDYLLC